MGRACNCLLTTFRVIQLVLSLVALACGVYITYTMYSVASAADDLQTAVTYLADKQFDSGDSDISEWFDGAAESAIDTIADGLNPVLNYLQETPTRAIVISAVGLWSLLVITYLFFAHRSKNHERSNRRAVRIPLELLTLLAWLGAITCAILLALQYSALALSGGIAIKTALKIAEKALEAALNKVRKKSNTTDDFLEALDMMGDITTIGILAVISAVSSLICVSVSFISLIIACCMSGKKKDKKNQYDGEKQEHGTPMSAQPLNGSFQYHQYQNNTPTSANSLKGGFNGKGPVSYVAEATAPWQSHYVPATLPTPFTPPSTYRPKVSYTPFADTQYEPYYQEDNNYYVPRRQ